MREILADLVAEQQGLDQSLQRAPDRDWKKRVEGFTVQETIAILAWEEQHAARALTGDKKVRKEVNSYEDLDAFVAAGAAKGKGKRPQEVIEWWRFARADVVDALSRMKADERVPWVDGKVSARTFATLRLAETWARGLAILEGLDKEIVDTPASGMSPGWVGRPSPMPSRRRVRTTTKPCAWSWSAPPMPAGCLAPKARNR